MAKEITLEDLANSVTPAKSSTQTIADTTDTKSTDSTITTPTPKHNDNITAGGKVDPSTLGAHLRDVNHIEDPKKIVMEDAPLVKNAFSAMQRTLAEKKKFMDENVVPVIMENAQEMAAAREMGQDVFNTEMGEREETVDYVPEVTNNETITTQPNDQIVTDDIDYLNNSYAEEDDDGIEVAPTAHIPVEQPTTIPEKKTEPVATEQNKQESERTVTTMEPVEVDEDDLDALMKDLDSADKSLNVTDEEEETAEEIRERFKESLESVKVTRDPIDLSKFKISRNVVSSATILTGASNTTALKKADWALLLTGRSMTFNECRGPELDNLQKSIRNSNSINGVIASLQFIYNHTVDANKPTFEQWCKLIRTEDVESLYFGLYKACYGDSNLLARTCEADGCKKTSLIDTPIDSMVKFADTETEEKFKSILNRDTTTESTTVSSTMVQISDNFVISYSVPTLYSTFLQYATLKEEVTNKYSEILNTMAYVDGFFRIDRESMSLEPIAIKEYPNNLNKTVISRLKVYTSILKTLTNDQYNVLMAKLNNIAEEPKISYIYPEATCPECGSKIEESSIDSILNLLFTRARLVQIKSL